MGLKKSTLEETLALQLRAVGLPEPTREHRFAPPRRWRFDFAYPDRMLAIECEGGVWTGGRHTRGAGFIADAEKYNRAALLGWRVLRFTREAIRSGEAIDLIEEAIKADRWAETKLERPDLWEKNETLEGRKR